MAYRIPEPKTEVVEKKVYLHKGNIEFFRRFSLKLAIVIAISFIGGIFAAFSYKNVSTPIKGDYCYIEIGHQESYPALYQHVPYHLDRMIIRSDIRSENIQMLKATAETINCEIKQ